MQEFFAGEGVRGGGKPPPYGMAGVGTDILGGPWWIVRLSDVAPSPPSVRTGHLSRIPSGAQVERQEKTDRPGGRSLQYSFYSNRSPAERVRFEEEEGDCGYAAFAALTETVEAEWSRLLLTQSALMFLRNMVFSASEGMRWPVLGETVKCSTAGPSIRQLRLNCWEK